MDYYHVIDLPDGTSTSGATDHRDQPAYLGIDAPGLLAGKRALDIAALDGFWAFWLERAGADDVLAIDVETYENYDWGFDGPPDSIAELAMPRKDEGFWRLHKQFDSKVRRESCSVYDLDPDKHGQYDAVFMYGLLYHLRHPLLSFDRIRAVCQGFLVVETHVVASQSDLPVALFYEDDVLGGAPTNWTGPTESCVVHWLKSAGFPRVFAERVPANKPQDRQRFIAVVDEAWLPTFDGNANFQLCADDYFARSRARVVGILESNPHVRPPAPQEEAAPPASAPPARGLRRWLRWGR